MNAGVYQYLEFLNKLPLSKEQKMKFTYSYVEILKEIEEKDKLFKNNYDDVVHRLNRDFEELSFCL